MLCIELTVIIVLLYFEQSYKIMFTVAKNLVPQHVSELFNQRSETVQHEHPLLGPFQTRIL